MKFVSAPAARLAVGLAGLLGAAAMLHADALGAAPRTYRIDFILYRGCEEACQSFQTQLAKLGVNARIRLLDAAQDREKLRRHVATVKADRPDLAVVWGTSAALEAVGPYDVVDPSRHITDLPVLFMVVSQPLATKIVSDYTAPGRDVTGVRYLLPLETQLRAARAYYDFRRVGLIYNPWEANSLIARDELNALAGRFGYALIERAVLPNRAGKPDPASIPAQVAELAKAGADIIYQPPDSFLNVHSDALTAAALEHRVPVFAAAEAPVLKSQALFGVAIRYTDLGRHTAHLAKKILVDGRAARDLPVELPRHFSYLINMDVAAKLDRYPPLKLLDVAELTAAGPSQNRGDRP